MRVNVYAEEMTDRVEIVEKDGFTGLRFYLELPVTKQITVTGPDASPVQYAAQVSGPFMHKPGDDDSAAVTFWGKKDLSRILEKAIDMLDEHHRTKRKPEYNHPMTGKCLDFHGGQCHSLTHTCEGCPDRSESDTSFRSRIIRYAGGDLDASIHTTTGAQLDDIGRKHGLMRMNTR